MKRAKKDKGVQAEIIVPEVTPVTFKVGAATKYDASMIDRTLDLAKLGLTLLQLGTAFGVRQETIIQWMHEHPKMRDAYEAGKYVHDHAVQLTLLQRALGYSYEEVMERSGVDSLGREYSYTTKTLKRVLPDTTAIIFWLKNRDPENYRDVNRQEIAANIDVNLSNTLKLDNLSEEQRKLVQGIAMKQIQGMNGIVDGNAGS